MILESGPETSLHENNPIGLSVDEIKHSSLSSKGGVHKNEISSEQETSSQQKAERFAWTVLFWLRPVRVKIKDVRTESPENRMLSRKFSSETEFL